jgi:alpha-tubulin suppressor-like RCC1 family protein
VDMVGCGSNFTVVLGKNEKVYTFGNGAFGVLGLDSYAAVSTPT